MGYGFGMGFGWLLPLFIIGLSIYFIKDNNNNNHHRKTSAQDILDKRYASGGISKEEYDEKSKHLRQNA